MAKLTGEFRKPKKGEYYLSGGIPEAYRAKNDLSMEYYILRLVKVRRIESIVEVREEREMAHFYGGVSGQGKTTATRLGSKNSGLETFANSWTVGVKCYGSRNRTADRDEIYVYMTGGSDPDSVVTFLGKVIETKDGPVFEPGVYVKVVSGE